MERKYLAIDLKSFYASVECVERGLDPLKTNLVVADESRTSKTICLAVSPSLKSLGVPGRPRLFEVIHDVNEINKNRRYKLQREFTGSSVFIDELDKNPELKLDYIVAPPRMSKYIHTSTEVYKVYLKWVKPEDIHVYSIDEVFIDITDYLKLYNADAETIISKIILDIYNTTGITATGGVGTNLYLSKIAMDILAKHRKANEHGVRIAILDEMSYRRALWGHMPLTDFWRLGKGYSRRLQKFGLFTMGDIARFSIDNADKLYKEFGVNAELLIDHAWGYEPCRISDIKAYKPEKRSVSSGQVLPEPTVFSEALTIIKEMAEAMSYDLVSENLVTKKLSLTVQYDTINLEKHGQIYTGERKIDSYGRMVPKDSHGTINLEFNTSSTRILREKTEELFRKIVDSTLYIRKMYLVAIDVIKKGSADDSGIINQLSLFNAFEKKDTLLDERLEKEEKVQKAMLEIKRKYGKNSVLKGMNLLEGARQMERNCEIGGHRS